MRDQLPEQAEQILDPIVLSNKVKERYLGYLETTFAFRDGTLRDAFRSALRNKDLARGPYVEARPVFRLGSRTDSLLKELVGPVDRCFCESLGGARRLYQHQEETIRRVFAGRNVVLATGTGSGKTEAFLIPVLLSLYGEFLEHGALGPGVRALILYPMNALAFDQRDRLRSIAERLSDAGDRGFRFTFGQYTGHTPENTEDTRRSAAQRLEDRLSHVELVTRNEMRTSPPHILLTNYSMLEYLLLRPDDCPLFDKGASRYWRFLIVDEVHQYRGYKGTELAMLIRRLKARLSQGGCQGRLQCIATSASLAGGDEDKYEVAQFAASLFGEPFEETDVILGQTIPIRRQARLAMPTHVYKRLATALEQETVDLTRAIADVACEVGSSVKETAPWPQALGGLLLEDQRVEGLREALSDRPRLVTDLASSLFPGEGTDKAIEMVTDMVRVSSAGVDPETGVPLLAARYHLFLRSLDGAYVSFWPSVQVRLEPPEDSGTESVFFEVALCRLCGQHYLVGECRDGYLRAANRDPSDPEASASYFMPVEDDAELPEEGSAQFQYLCVRCGAIATTNPHCGHEELIRVIQAPCGEAAHESPDCLVCQNRSPDPIREVVHGADGPNAVIATTLVEELPKARRKVLAFADSRQEAAFFAWYLEQSVQDLRARAMMLKLIRAVRDPNGLSLEDLAHRLKAEYRRLGFYPESAGDETVLRHAWRDVFREFVTQELRISLEGLGLARWHCRRLANAPFDPLLERIPWLLSPQEAFSLVHIFLNFSRLSRNVGEPYDSLADLTLSWDDLALPGPPRSLGLGPPRARRNIDSWDGYRTRRGDYLKKVLLRRRSSEAISSADLLKLVQEVATFVWDWIRELDRECSESERLLIRREDGLVLNPAWWSLIPTSPNEPLMRCQLCGQIHNLAIDSVCTRYGCRGTLAPWSLATAEPNHYRQLYENMKAVRLRSEEHTAQLSYEQARDYQNQFKRGQIDVLSSSTTFELGVDLGDLDVVFLRNVPPEAFNYVQRVGRAGRRSGHPGFAVTYCRRSSHDMYHFTSPEPLIQGRARMATLNINNVKIAQRHLAATALADFFHENEGRFRCVAYFLDTVTEPTVLETLLVHLLKRHDYLVSIFRKVFERSLWDGLGILDGTWIQALIGPDSRLAEAVAEVTSDARRLLAMAEGRNTTDSRFKSAGIDKKEWAYRRLRAIETEDVVGFLSRKGVIPKYGFPVDVVELDVPQASVGGRHGFNRNPIKLERDLSIAIADYAPGCEVIADKKLWVSQAIKTVPDRALERWEYVDCPTHFSFVAWKLGEDRKSLPCGCVRQVRQAVIPRFGFRSSQPARTPSRKPLKLYTTRPRLLGISVGTDDSPTDYGPVRAYSVSPGTLFVLCEGSRGQGFLVCDSCGLHVTAVGKSHEDYYGEKCSGRFTRLSLAHHFVTDVIRIELALPPGPLKGLALHSDESLSILVHSVAYAILEGAAEALDVPPTDLNVTLRAGGSSLPTIVLYDACPGGAGLVVQLQKPDVLHRCLTLARERVAGPCGCGDLSSCYGCLRSYRNQHVHHLLKRGPAHEYLSWALDCWPKR